MPSLRNRYEMLRPIASGGMGTVYLGMRRGAGGFERPVAIKVMHPALAKDPNLVAMFFDEARIAANIRHMNVVATLDVAGGDDGSLCLVMEYVEGYSLRDMAGMLSARGEGVPLDVVLRIMLDVLAGLHAAHELTASDGSPLGLVHRDISPHNVLVSNDGIAKLTDFGIARTERRLSCTRAGQIKGKLAYMPIEQMRGRALDRRADVYATSVVLWELLAGERLFTGAHEGALALAVCHGPSRAPHEVVPAVPAPISLVCMRGLRADPEQRYPTAAAFADALEAAVAEAGVDVAPRGAVAALCARITGYRREAPSVTTTSGINAPKPPSSVRSLGDTRTRSFTELGVMEVLDDPEEPGSGDVTTVQGSVPSVRSTRRSSDPTAPPSSNLPVTDTHRPVSLDYFKDPAREATGHGRLAALLKHRSSLPMAGVMGAVLATLLWFAFHGVGAVPAHVAATGVRRAAPAVSWQPALVHTAEAPVAQVLEVPTAQVLEIPAVQVSASDADAKEERPSVERARAPRRALPGKQARPASRRAPRATQLNPAQKAPSRYRPVDL